VCQRLHDSTNFKLGSSSDHTHTHQRTDEPTICMLAYSFSLIPPPFLTHPSHTRPSHPILSKNQNMGTDMMGSTMRALTQSGTAMLRVPPVVWRHGERHGERKEGRKEGRRTMHFAQMSTALTGLLTLFCESESERREDGIHPLTHSLTHSLTRHSLTLSNHPLTRDTVHNIKRKRSGQDYLYHIPSMRHHTITLSFRHIPFL
jgi:hypothetical protein